MLGLAKYAANPAESRGRHWPEPESTTRTAFARDRDRIIHCTAFRRLEYKTQVFVNHEGDLYRTRLTHSLEVAQIARSLARHLALNEDLVEAIALAHDLGHTPFGHAGQDELNECMRPWGGFEHNLQSLRVVDQLEERYAAFDGLNLTYETREGILKHCSIANAQKLGEIGQRFLTRQSPSLEAQLTNIADEIAYNNHDIDDGLRSGHLALDQLDGLTLWDEHRATVQREWPQLAGRRLVSEIVRRMINGQIEDLLENIHVALKRHQPESIAQVRSLPPLVDFSAPMREANLQLKQFLRRNLYLHYQVQRMSNKARRIVHELFEAFSNDNRLLPPQYQTDTTDHQHRLIADYIAGMTDRYALREHRKLFSSNEQDSMT
jgi:dGTPase